MKLKLIDWLILIGSISLLLFLCLMCLGCVIYIKENMIPYMIKGDIYSVCYNGGLLLAIFSGFIYFIEKYVNSFAESFQNIFVKK